jgi:hypothetical protein
MISTKFCPNQINRFDSIRLFVNFNHALAAILDFAHYVPGGMTSQNASGSQIDQYVMTFIPANFHISITKCSVIGVLCVGRVQLMYAYNFL